ncbi:MAG: hypothetical protein JEZ14_09530 [Marinilabiliaceae bacterium]|nr:hypothetical protein [Marinilabiliaceae bacterium]
MTQQILKIALMLLLPVLLVAGCEKEEQQLCGCESETIYTIPKDACLYGQMTYKVQLDPNDNFYNKKFWISYIDNNCKTCIHTFIVCNESYLPNGLLMLANSKESKAIRFSGYIKEICNQKFDVADKTYERIILTSIEML